jgi:hypothetical protein
MLPVQAEGDEPASRARVVEREMLVDEIDAVGEIGEVGRPVLEHLHT